MYQLPVITGLAAQAFAGDQPPGLPAEPPAVDRRMGAAPRRPVELAISVMPKVVEQALRARRTEIRSRWLELLFVEPVNTPLANPRAMIFLLDETLDSIFALLRRGPSSRTVAAPDCPCGRNPYLSYFRAGRQALFEALVLLQSQATTLDPAERDTAVLALDLALRQIAAEAIEGFGSLCRHRATGFTPCDHPDCDRIDGVAQPGDELDDRMD